MSKIDLTVGAAASLVLGGIATLLLALVWCSFWTGLTLSILWGWFVAPIFALPVLTTWQAYGIALAYRAMRGFEGGKKAEEEFGAAIARAIFTPPFAAGLTLGVGWLVKSWV